MTQDVELSQDEAELVTHLRRQIDETFEQWLERQLAYENHRIACYMWALIVAATLAGTIVFGSAISFVLLCVSLYTDTALV